MYTWSSGITMRRLVDTHKDAISFFRFLSKLKTNPGTLTRDRYKAMFVRGDYTEREADALWDKLVGEGKAAPSDADIDAEIAVPKQKTEVLVRFIDRRIAHRDRKEADAVPTVKDLDDAIDYLEQLLRKYYNLFRALDTPDLLPVWQYDWKVVFNRPWVEGCR